jgi:ABC-2 type transport system permease protein
VVDREQLVRKIHFPRLAIPLSVVLTATFNLGLNIVVVFIFAVSLGIDVRWTWLELPFLVVALGLFVVGLASLLSALYVRFRDIRPIWEVALQVLFYGSMIIVPFETVFARFETLARVLLANPLAAIVQQARHAVVDPEIPGTATAMGGWVYGLIPLAIVLATTVVGLWVFNHEAPRIAEDL